jgi:signal recognition particle subunit SEC65
MSAPDPDGPALPSRGPAAGGGFPAAAAAAAAAQQQAAPKLTPQQKHARNLRFQVIYPQYLDSSLTKKHGRRLTEKQSVQNPTVAEMYKACVALGFRMGRPDAPDTQIFAEGKSLPRNQSQPYCVPPARGCIRVAIKEPAAAAGGEDADRKSNVAAVPNKMALMRAIAEHIKNIPDRKIEVNQAQEAAKMSAEAMASYMNKERKNKAPKQQRVKAVMRR